MNRLLVKIVGDEVDPEVRPILVAQTTGVTAMYAFFGFFALYAIEALHMRQASVGLALLAGSLTGMVVGFVAGRISDRIGRRPLIVTGTAVQCLVPLPLVAAPHVTPPLAVAVLLAMSVLQPLRMAPMFALVVDVVAEERRERALAALRIAFNAGALAGPLAAAALIAVGWRALHLGIAVILAVSFAAALRLPRPVGWTPAPARGLALGMLRERTFLLVFAAVLAATITYNAFETLFPISLTTAHGVAPSEWGALFVINPILVMLMQMRVTRWTGGWSLGAKLGLALPTMGLAFLPLLVSSALPVLVLIMVVFVLGEMLWAPSADALIARIAPADGRGAFIGTLGVAGGTGSALAPAAGLHVRAAAGDTAMWFAVAAVSLVAAALYATVASSPDRGRARSRVLTIERRRAPSHRI